MIKISKQSILMCIILFAIFIAGIYYLHMKSGFYVDEGMTFVLANGHYNGAVTARTEYGFTDFLNKFVIKETIPDTVQNVYDMLCQVIKSGDYSKEGTVEWYDAGRKMLQGNRTWLKGTELLEEVIAEKGGRFQFGQVYLNQVMDVHPPLYYAVVHMIFSFFYDAYSNTWLFGINIVFLLATCILLYSLLKNIGNDSKSAIMVIMLYGFSQAFFSCAMYFRMYAMQTFWIVLTLYIHLLFRNRQWQFRIRDRVLTVLTVVCGFGTHYYYILYLLPLFFVTCLRLWKYNRKILTQYVKIFLAAAIVSLLIWPFSIYHILFSYRGTEAISNLNLHGLWNRIVEYGQILLHSVLLDNYILLFGVAVLVVGSFVICWNPKLNKKYCDVPLRWLMENGFEIYIPLIFYFLVVIKIAPAASCRYIMGILPIVFLILSICISNIVKVFIESSFGANAITVGISAVYAVASLVLTTPEYLYLDQRNLILGTDHPKKDMNCIMITDDDYRAFPEILKLSEFNQVIVIEENDFDSMVSQRLEGTDIPLLIYIFSGMNQDKTLYTLSEIMEIKTDNVSEIESNIADFNAFLLN